MSIISNIPHELHPLFASFLDYDSVIMYCTSNTMIQNIISNDILFWKSHLINKGCEGFIDDLNIFELREVSKISNYVLKGVMIRK